MNKSNLKKEIKKKLDELDVKVGKIRNTQIDADDEAKWDYDHYSGLLSKLEEALKLFENKELVPKKLDEYGDPVISEKGILKLLNEWHEETSEDDDE